MIFLRDLVLNPPAAPAKADRTITMGSPVECGEEDNK
jgi:hypothetical protein